MAFCDNKIILHERYFLKVCSNINGMIMLKLYIPLEFMLLNNNL